MYIRIYIHFFPRVINPNEKTIEQLYLYCTQCYNFHRLNFSRAEHNGPFEINSVQVLLIHALQIGLTEISQVKMKKVERGLL